MSVVRSCDTFVALPPATANGCVVFGKNSDRPCSEVQEVVYFPAADHTPGGKLECTYIEIPQAAHTNAIALSKPSWMWGAEMGANEHGVCIGNEAVWTKLNGPTDAEPRLLGMDLVRLGLERGSTAKEAMDVVVALLEKHGQGGNCAESRHWPMTYHNSFIIADQSEAWVLETAGSHWAAECVKSGVRNISNQLSIRTKIDAMSSDCQDFARAKGWWHPDKGAFDFAKAYSDDAEEIELPPDQPPCGRYQWGRRLLEEKSKGGKFSAKDMISILRHEDSDICMTGSFLSTGSQVSVLPKSGSDTACCHWFTGTPNPKISMFKPFVFCDNVIIGEETSSPQYGDNDPVKQKPRFQTTVDREHPLWRSHGRLRKWLDAGEPRGEELVQQMQELEAHCVEDMQEVLTNMDDRSKMRVAMIFEHMVNLEMNFYK